MKFKLVALCLALQIPMLSNAGEDLTGYLSNPFHSIKMDQTTCQSKTNPASKYVELGAFDESNWRIMAVNGFDSKLVVDKSSKFGAWWPPEIFYVKNNRAYLVNIHPDDLEQAAAGPLSEGQLYQCHTGINIGDLEPSENSMYHCMAFNPNRIDKFMEDFGPSHFFRIKNICDGFNDREGCDLDLLNENERQLMRTYLDYPEVMHLSFEIADEYVCNDRVERELSFFSRLSLTKYLQLPKDPYKSETYGTFKRSDSYSKFHIKNKK